MELLMDSFFGIRQGQHHFDLRFRH